MNDTDDEANLIGKLKEMYGIGGEANDRPPSLRSFYEDLGTCFEGGEIEAIDLYRFSLLLESALKGSALEFAFRVGSADVLSMYIEVDDLGEFELTLRRPKLSRSNDGNVLPFRRGNH